MKEIPLSECYRLLELPSGASPAAVREAYRALSRVWHPDRFAGNPDLLARANARQQELNTAYQRLLRAFESGYSPNAAGVGGRAADSDTATAAAGEAAEQRADPDAPAAQATPGGLHVGPRGPRVSRWARQHPAATVTMVAASVVAAAALLVLSSGLTTVVRTADGAPLDATDVSVGGGHACAVHGKRLSCWGRNDLGQAGQPGQSETKAAASVPVSRPAVAVATGFAHSCALLIDGEAYCWGGNFAGQLGDLTLRDHARPGRVAGPGGYRRISALARHTCAVTDSGVLRCWGDDTDGQLGIGSPAAECRLDDLRFYCADHPQQVTHERAWSAVSSGGSHTCALDAAGVVYCWGSNRYGQLGDTRVTACRGPDGVQPCRRRPAAVPGLATRVVAVATGASHSCALDTSGRAWCWGKNDLGQAGGEATSPAQLPRPLATALRFKELVAGGYHTCGITGDGALYCWGSDARGELHGLGRDRCADVRCARSPTRIASAGVSTVAAGFGRTCVAASAGGVRCWGKGYSELAPAGKSPAGRSGGGNRAWRNISWFGGSLYRLVAQKVIFPLERLAH